MSLLQEKNTDLFTQKWTSSSRETQTDSETVRKSLKRRLEPEILPSKKKLTPFTNTPIERKQDRRRLLRSCQKKLNSLKSYESTLCKRLLIQSVMRRVQTEITDANNQQHQNHYNQQQEPKFNYNNITTVNDSNFSVPSCSSENTINNNNNNVNNNNNNNKNSTMMCEDFIEQEFHQQVDELYKHMQIYFPDQDCDLDNGEKFQNLSNDMETVFSNAFSQIT